MLVVRQTPNHRIDSVTNMEPRHRDLLLVIPQKHLAQRAHLFKAEKHSANGLLHFSIWRHFDPCCPASNIANRHLRHHLSAPDFLVICLPSALSKDPYLEFTHRSFQTQKHTIIEQAGIIDAFGVDHNRFGEHAQIDQMVPITIIASQSRSFQCEDTADFTVAYGCQKPPESWPLATPRARYT